MIALIAAVPFETELLRLRLSLTARRGADGVEIHDGVCRGLPVCLMHSGVGKVNGALAAATLLASSAPAALVSFGCGGAYAESGLAVGDLALADAEIFGDEGVLAPEGFLDMERLGFPLEATDSQRYFNRFPVSAPLLAAARPLLQREAQRQGVRLGVGPLVTVSTCSGTDQAGRELARRTGGLCETMEGAAVAQVCLRYQVPFLELRGISNLTEDRDLQRWRLPEAAAVAQHGVMALLEQWPQKDVPA